MTIDAHVHFWNYEPVKDSWITNEMKVIQRDFLPNDLSAILHDNEVDGCVAVQASQNQQENLFLLNLAAKHEFIKAVVGWADLGSPLLEEYLNLCKSHKKLKGFRHVAQAEPSGFLLRNDILEGIRLLGQHHFTYDILIYEHQLDDAIQLSNKLPGQHFILDHCAKPSLRTNDLQNWKVRIEELSMNPHIFCKISGLLTEDHWHKCNEKQLYECFDVVFESFGTGRILFGSDWPVILIAGQYRQWKSLVKNYITQFPAEEQAAIFGGNARNFYKLQT